MSEIVPLWQISATPRSMRLADDLIGQHRRAIEEIHEAVAIRTEEGQVAGAVEQLARQPPPGVGAELGETRA